jgi:hypothetical protein
MGEGTLTMPPWYKDPIVLLSAAAVGGSILFFGGAKELANVTTDVFTRGNHVTYGTLDPTLGIVLESPSNLRDAAGQRMGIVLDDNAYALARMIRSEGAAEGLLRAHVAMNDAATFPYASDLFGLLTFSNDPQRRGVYGAQWSPAVPPNYPKANARRYATSKDPYEGDVNMAIAAIAERANGVDRADGAVKFIDKSSMGVQLGSKSFEEIDAAWQGDGLIPFTLADYGPDLVLYKKA